MSDRLVKLVFNKEGKERLDVFLTGCLPEFSRSRIQGLIRNSFVTVGGEPVTKTGRDLESGERISFTAHDKDCCGLMQSLRLLNRLLQPV